MTRAERLIADVEAAIVGAHPDSKIGIAHRALRPLLDALIECGKAAMRVAATDKGNSSPNLNDCCAKLKPYFRERAEWTVARVGTVWMVRRDGAVKATFSDTADCDAYLAAKIKEERDGE